MKFAKELERELVPEWRAKYLDYKPGKKKVKAISKALRNAANTPRRFGSNAIVTPSANSPGFLKYKDGINGKGDGNVTTKPTAPAKPTTRNNGSDAESWRQSATTTTHSERQPLRESERGGAGLRRYGSIIGSPPDHRQPSHPSPAKRPPSLDLPDPALDPDSATIMTASSTRSMSSASHRLPKLASMGTTPGSSAFQVGETKSPKSPASLQQKRFQLLNRVNSLPTRGIPRPFQKRLFTTVGATNGNAAGDEDVPLDAYREVDFRQAEFFNFLDAELLKIETYYKEKEDEATERLSVLREQLHIMRDRRLEELSALSKPKQKQKVSDLNLNGDAPLKVDGQTDVAADKKHRVSWMRPLDTALAAARPNNFGKGTRALQELGTPHALRPQNPDDERDYTRRADIPDVPYRTAKRKLKVALQEFYRGLELLKSYALLNRTGFRKINKKYDKAVNARPAGRYMAEKVNTAWFVKSDVLDNHLNAVEDLYARYFEQGNHKIALGKLRVKSARAHDHSDTTFRNGLWLAAGTVFSIQGIVYAAESLFSVDLIRADHTKFLLQIYAGYFLILLLFLLFCLDCRLWTESKINYVFIFEFENRTHLDWRQLAEIPCFLLFLEAVFLWINFSKWSGDTMFFYWPVILLGLTAIILFLPLRTLYHRSRRWLLYSLWRLLMAGIYPVEFRDFFLGDMFCSLTFAMGNIEMFFCLYARNFENGALCNSSNSRLLGFLSTLPAIWRALQCVRRYYDTRNVFPHLVICGKYSATILFYVTLSCWRINSTNKWMGTVIFSGIVNSVYCSIWDVVMDWSLGDPYARHPFLRKTLGYKHAWWYYFAMIVDPILRFNWIFYIIFRGYKQHTALLSFLIALSEVLRRALWTIFRVENEHSTNVGRFRASRDVPLPYDLIAPSSGSSPSPDEEQQDSSSIYTDGHGSMTGGSTTGTDRNREPVTTRRRRRSVLERPSPLLNRMGTIMHTAHAQDFQRRRSPEVEAAKAYYDDTDDEEGDDSDNVDPDDTEVERAEDQIDRSGAQGSSTAASAA